ncbi:MAG: hypothetical protein MZV63_33995 [Marinilabiliales bacterium]|nr:hypothetical protein [Marinilabiliales bacterium]
MMLTPPTSHPYCRCLIEKFGISLFLSGLLGVIQRIPNLLNPFIGIMAERVKVRYFVIFAPAVTTIAMSLIGVAPLYIVVAILLFVCGLSSALFHVPAPVMISKVSGSRTGKGMSFYVRRGICKRRGPAYCCGCGRGMGPGWHAEANPLRHCRLSSAVVAA